MQIRRCVWLFIILVLIITITLPNNVAQITRNTELYRDKTIESNSIDSQIINEEQLVENNLLKLRTQSSESYSNPAKLFNFSKSWIIGPGKAVLKIFGLDNYTVVGTDSGYILYAFGSNEAIQRFYLNDSVSFIKLLKDDSGSIRILVGTRTGIFLIHDINGNELFNTSVDGLVLAAGIVPFYSALEKDVTIVSNHSIYVYALDGSMVKRDYVSEHITAVTIGDFDNDGLSEIALGTEEGLVVIYDSSNIYSNFIGYQVNCISSGDLDEDGSKEIFVGANNGYVYVFSYDATILQKVAISSKGISGVVIDDFDDDSLMEFFAIDETGFSKVINTSYDSEWTYNYSLSIEKVLLGNMISGSVSEILLVSTNLLRCIGYNVSGSVWQIYWNYTSNFNINDACVCDFDTDTFSEIAYGGKNNTFVYLENDSAFLDSVVYTIYADSIASADIDNDGLAEIVASGIESSVWMIEDNDTIGWNVDIGVNVSAIYLDDIDFDDYLEIILFCANNSVIRLNLDGSEVFNYAASSEISELVISEINEDSQKEIVVATRSGVYILNSTGYLLRTILSGENISCAISSEVMGDQNNEIILGLSNGSIIIYNYVYDNTSSLDLQSGTIVDLASLNTDKDAYKELIGVSVTGNITLFDPESIIWWRTVNEPLERVKTDDANKLIVILAQKSLIAFNYSGHLLWNISLIGIYDYDVSDLTGDNSCEIIITVNNSLLIFSDNGSKVDSEMISSELLDISVFDIDHNIVNDSVMASIIGILQAKSIPTLVIVDPVNNSLVNKSNILVKWVFSGVAPFRFSILLNGIEVSSIQGIADEANISIPYDDVWEISVKCIPKSGTTLTSTIQINVDTQSPILSILAPANNTFSSNKNITMTWYGTDENSGISHYEIRIDNQDWIDVDLNTSYTFSNLEYGRHYLWLKGVDNAGNSNITYISVFIDYIKPVIQFVNPNNESYINQSSFNVNWTYVEDNLDRFELYVDYVLSYQGNNTSFTVENLMDGSHIITLICRDLAGNNATKNITIYIDTISPSLIIVSPQNNTYSSSRTVQVVIDYQDANMDRILWRFNDSDWHDSNLNETIWIDVENDGLYIFYIMAIDKAGNYNISKLVVYIDTYSPVIAIITPVNSTYINISQIYAKWSSFDNGSGVDHYEIRVDDGAWVNIGLTNEITLSITRDGAHLLYVKAYDKAGNYRIACTKMIIDTIPPYVEIISPQNDTITNMSRLELVLSFEDENMAYIEFYLNDSLIATFLSSTYTLTLNTDGEYIITLIAYDLAGNTANSVLVVTYDASSPVIVLLNENVNGTAFTNASFTIKWAAFDNLSGIEGFYISMDYGEFVFVGTKTEYEIDLTELSLGNHTVLIRAYDKAGNFAEILIIFEKSKEKISQPTLDLPTVIASSLIIIIVLVVDIYYLVLRKRTS